MSKNTTSTPGRGRSAEVACSAALAALYEAYNAAIDAWFKGDMFDGEKERLLEVMRIHAAIKEERSRSQCQANAPKSSRKLDQKGGSDV